MLDGLMSRWMIALLVGVLHRLADRHEQLQPLARRQAVVVAVLRDRHALDQLHDEEGPAVLRRPGVEDPGDVGMVHQGQGLPLGLEAGDDLAAVHARLDQLEGDLAAAPAAVCSAIQTVPMPPSPICSSRT